MIKIVAGFLIGIALAFFVEEFIRNHETRAVAIYTNLHSMALYSYLPCDEVRNSVCLKHDTSPTGDATDAASYEQLRVVLCKSPAWSAAEACGEVK